MMPQNDMAYRTFQLLFLVCVLFLVVSCTKESNSRKPTILTGEVTELTATWALIAGNELVQPDASVTAMGVTWDTMPDPVVAHQQVPGQTEGAIFESKISGLQGDAIYYVRAFATNDAGTAYGNQLTFATPSPDEKPLVETRGAKQINIGTAKLQGEVKKHGGTAVTQCGIMWSADPDLDSHGTYVYVDAGIGTFDVSVEGLDSESVYYYKAFADNDSGRSYGQKKVFFTPAADACQGVSAPAGFGVIAFDERCWLDRNLGALRVAQTLQDENAYGSLYQWGRGPDGHQHPSSGTTETLALPGEQPHHSDFIVKYAYPFDWNADNGWVNRWALPNGNTTNADPCPNGWRVPTSAEWQSAIAYGNWKNKQDAFNSPLRLPAAGKRDDKGVLEYQDSRGYYWSSSHKNIFGEALNAFDTGIFITSYYRVGGMSVRCIKDD